MNPISISIFLFFCCLGFFSLSLISLLRLRRERRKILQIKNELQSSKDYIATIVESTLDTFISIAPEGKISVANCAIEGLLGYGKGELIGQTLERIIDSVWATTF